MTSHNRSIFTRKTPGDLLKMGRARQVRKHLPGSDPTACSYTTDKEG